MSEYLIRKLENGSDLIDDDRAFLREATKRTKDLRARQAIIDEGDEPKDVHVVVEGFACRYKILTDGSRQIMALLVPGDFCDLHVAILGAMDHGIATLSPCRIALLPRSTVEEITYDYPRLARAMWWATLVDEATLREWLANMGQRDAADRLAHLFCELYVRLRSVGLTQDHAFDLPMKQTDLAETLGMTPVHMNRSIQHLRAANLLEFRSGRVHLPDFERLQKQCGFTPNYLHLKSNHAPSLL